MTHPGVGALTALAFVLIIGETERFQCGKQIAAYLGLVPEEDSSGDSRRLGHISKQGSGLMRFLLVEAAQVTVRSDGEWRSKYFHLRSRPAGQPCSIQASDKTRSRHDSASKARYPSGDAQKHRKTVGHPAKVIAVKGAFYGLYSLSSQRSEF